MPGFYGAHGALRFQAMPPTAFDRARTSLRLRTLDLHDRVSGNADPLVPPRRMDFVGHSDFVATGDEFLEHFRNLAGLRADERVLDVGCGIGRMARPLAGFLSAAGRYDGFDINGDGIAWCRERYREHPNFTFAEADLFNQRYNPTGREPAESFTFPYPDGETDLVILTSVMTHLLEEACDHYLAEIRRVLAPGGRMLATYFLLDEEARELIAAGSSRLAFPCTDAACVVVDPAVPEEAVAYTDTWLHAALERHGLALRELRRGAWSGRAEPLSYQDIVVAGLA